LRHAKVFVTVMGTDTERETTLEALESHAYEIQGEVNRALRMKFVPRLSFAYDAGQENAMRVDQILRNLAEERKKSGVQTDSTTPDPADADGTSNDDET
jgi:ribosome-binding factor A